MHFFPHSKWFFGVGFAVVIMILFFLGALDTPIKHLAFSYERLMLRADPAVERAFNYGSAHFNSLNARLYDIEMAEFFFIEAAFIDPEYPYLNHQLARIEFLRGRFDSAIARINKEIRLYGDSEPNTYYIRGLIYGYRGDYDEAINDYKTYLESDPGNWAALTDLTWVLLKAEHNREAHETAQKGLALFPDNPWLLNADAIARYEMGDFEGAYESAIRAQEFVSGITEQEWLTAYPGNHPATAGEGVHTLKTAIENNIHSIALVLMSDVGQNE